MMLKPIVKSAQTMRARDAGRNGLLQGRRKQGAKGAGTLQ